ncbi:MAG: glycosyltransferase family 39 protein [Chloroflexi bacterium]|nr:glycosyltransferase family 39 protein [Chloroflexota bacterium]
MNRIPRSILAALIAITSLAAIARFTLVDSIPPGYWYDEAHKSIVALEIARGLQSPLYTAEGQGIEAGYFWLLAGVFKIFGASYFATRYLSAFIGTLTVPLTFWSIKKLYNDDRLALLSTGVSSFLLWHVHWSRTGLETILVPFFSIFLLGLMEWAWQKQTWWAFVLAGAVLGLSQYTNPGARVLPLQALITFLILGMPSLRVFEKQSQNATEIASRRTLAMTVWYGLIFLFAASIIYAPLGWFFLNNPDWFFSRVAYTSENARAGGWAFILDSAIKTLLSLNFRGDVMQRHNLSLRPAFDVLTSLWMFVGLGAMMLKRDRWASHLVLISAIAINLAPMVFSDGAPGFGRTLGASPLVVVLPALGMMLALEWRRHLRWIVIGSLCLSAILNLSDYFIRYPNQTGMFDSYEVGLWSLLENAARESQTQPTYLLLNEPAIQHPATRMMRELNKGDLRIINGESCWVYPATTTRPTIFVTHANWLPRIEAEFKNFSVIKEIVHEPEPYLYGATVRVEKDQASVSGSGAAIATFGDALELIALDAPNEINAGAALPINLRWRSQGSPPIRYTTFVHLATRDKPFFTGVDGEPCAAWYPTNQWHAGEVVQYQLTLNVPHDLPPNTYDIMIGVYDAATAERLQVKQTDGREADRAFAKIVIVKK